MKNLATIAATAIVLLILLATTLPLMHWFTSAGRDAALSDGEALWSGVSIDDYDLTVLKTCDCAPPAGTPVRFSVRGGQVSARQRASDSSDVSADDIRRADVPETVAALFKRVRDAIEDDPDTLYIEYDSDYGYPREIRIDRRKAYADDDVSYTVVSFQTRDTDER